MGFAPRQRATGPRLRRTTHGFVLLATALISACASAISARRVSLAPIVQPARSIDPSDAIASFEQALSARAREDDATANTLLDHVAHLRMNIADRRAVARLAQLDAIVADQHRRAMEPPRHFCFADAMAITDSRARIAGLIRDLDQASALITSDAFLEALVQQGSDAIDPLLDALDRDTRLTRNAMRDPETGGLRVESVADIAYRALFDLLLVPLHRTPALQWTDVRDGPRRHEFAATLRAYWTAVRGGH